MIQDLMRFTAEKIEEGQKVALVTLVEKSVNAPGASGQMMAVLSDGTTKGTVGGGAAEHKIIEQAKAAIRNHQKTFEFEYDLSENGMICGGKIKGFGNILGLGHRLILFGGGHVSQSIYPLAKSVGFHTIVVEERDAFIDSFPGAEYHVCKAAQVRDRITFDENTFIVICTRGHSFDFEALKCCIDQPNAYLGMIGSVKKVREVYQKMKDLGYEDDVLDKVYAPVGLEISDGTTNAIAVSVIAEILQVKNKGKLQHMKDRM